MARPAEPPLVLAEPPNQPEALETPTPSLGLPSVAFAALPAYTAAIRSPPLPLMCDESNGFLFAIFCDNSGILFNSALIAFGLNQSAIDLYEAAFMPKLLTLVVP